MVLRLRPSRDVKQRLGGHGLTAHGSEHHHEEEKPHCHHTVTGAEYVDRIALQNNKEKAEMTGGLT